MIAQNVAELQRDAAQTRRCRTGHHGDATILADADEREPRRVRTLHERRRLRQPEDGSAVAMTVEDRSSGGRRARSRLGGAPRGPHSIEIQKANLVTTVRNAEPRRGRAAETESAGLYGVMPATRSARR